VWHASISEPPWRRRDVGDLFAIAEQALAGVGDATAGEWREVGDVAVHLRRRLTAEEAAPIGPAVDIRGTWEHHKRIERLRRYLPPDLRHRPVSLMV
jgi:ribosomal protein L13E